MSDAAGIVEPCGDDPGMDEAVLLGPVERIGHRQLNLAGLKPCDRDAERPHRPLPIEGCCGDRAKVGILRLEARHAWR
jgi:hypothetical protein